VNAAPVAPATRKPLLAVVGVVIVVVLMAPALAGAGLLFHVQCQLTKNLGTESIWTPAAVVNSPPNGTAVGWANGSVLGPYSGSEVGFGNGSAEVVEADLNWTVFDTGMVWTLGPGVPEVCTVSLWPTVSGGSPTALAGCLLQGPGNASDENLSVSTPVPGCPFLGTNLSAEFNDSFVLSCPNGLAFQGYCGSFTWQDQGNGTVTLFESVLGFSIRIPLPGASPTTWISASDPVNQTVRYVLPGSGCWIEEQTGTPPGLPSGLSVWGPYYPYNVNVNINSACPFE
jgi:hypothetical protein